MKFAILGHDHPAWHWDLLLQHGACCRTWRIWGHPQEISMARLEATADHRLLYLEYEGPVSRGRGTVMCWDRGELIWSICRQDRIRCYLRGHMMRGWLDLLQMAGNWRATWQPQEQP